MTIHVFHKNELWLESEDWRPAAKLPPQSYIRDVDRFLGVKWYLLQQFGTMSNALPINRSDVPDWVRTCCLLMNLPV